MLKTKKDSGNTLYEFSKKDLCDILVAHIEKGLERSLGVYCVEPIVDEVAGCVSLLIIPRTEEQMHKDDADLDDRVIADDLNMTVRLLNAHRSRK